MINDRWALAHYVALQNPWLQPRRRFSRVAKYLVLAGVVAAVLWVVCDVVVTRS